jgi:hypothetical protein
MQLGGKFGFALDVKKIDLLWGEGDFALKPQYRPASFTVGILDRIKCGQVCIGVQTII